MRVLILYPFLVKTGSLGGVARVTRLVEYLAHNGHEVWLACFASREERADRDAYESVRRMCHEMIVLSPEKRPVARKALGLAFGQRPRYVDHFDSPAMRAEIGRILATQDIDVFHVEFTYLGDYVAQASGTDCATVLVDEELNFNADRLLFRSAPFSLRGLRALREARRFERYELAAAARFDHVLAIVEGERRMLLDRNPRLDVGLYPNAVDTTYFAPLEAEPDPGSMVFVGNFEHYPNVDGVTWFVRNVLPAVRRAVPDASLTIIGANATPAINRLARKPGVTVLGYVNDIRPHLAHSSAFVCPLVNGGGMRGKALEAMSMARPVVATRLGIDGIAARDREHALIADEPLAFAAALIRLLRDESLQARIGEAGRELVTEHYDDRVVFADLERTYLSLAHRHSSQPAMTSRGTADTELSTADTELSGVMRA